MGMLRTVTFSITFVITMVAHVMDAYGYEARHAGLRKRRRSMKGYRRARIAPMRSKPFPHADLSKLTASLVLLGGILLWLKKRYG